MKKSVTMQYIKDFNVYTCLNPSDDYRFGVIWRLFDPLWKPKQILNDFFYNTEKTITGDEYIEIIKEQSYIRIYDRSEWLNGPEFYLPYPEPENSNYFDISNKNFEEILTTWEKLRVSRPDTILIVIHEDNHVSLETDPVIIKQYQEAGYAFDIDKK